jgi:hypothetical protein
VRAPLTWPHQVAQVALAGDEADDGRRAGGVARSTSLDNVGVAREHGRHQALAGGVASAPNAMHVIL